MDQTFIIRTQFLDFKNANFIVRDCGVVTKLLSNNFGAIPFLTGLFIKFKIREFVGSLSAQHPTVIRIWAACRQNRRRQVVFAYTVKRDAIPRNRPFLQWHCSALSVNVKKIRLK